MQALKALVILMGIMIIVGVAVVVVTIYNRLGRMAEEAEAQAGFGEAAVAVPQGCRAAALVPVEGGRLAVRLEGGPTGGTACEQILVLDLGTGSVLGRFTLAPAAE